MQAIYDGPDGRRAFVRARLTAQPFCEAGLPRRCQGRSVDVHEAIPRSAGGAIVPGPKADEQGQEFFALCRNCDDHITVNPLWAKESGYRKPNPLRS